jgi:non-heme chloroperoxidase
MRGRAPQGPTVRAWCASGTCWASGVPHVVLPVLRSRTVTVTGSFGANACLGAVTLSVMCCALQFSKPTWAERVMVATPALLRGWAAAAAGAVGRAASAARAARGVAIAAEVPAIAAAVAALMWEETLGLQVRFDGSAIRRSRWLHVGPIRSTGMAQLPSSGSGSGSASSHFSPRGRSRRRGSRLVFIGAAVAAVGAAGVAYKRLAALSVGGDEPEDGSLSLGWGEGVSRPEHAIVRTSDGAELALWDLEGDGPDAPVVVLPHCWGCSHEIWLPVARRLRSQGFRVVLYDQRGHGASTRGTAPLAVETLAHDLEAVLNATDVRNVVLAGHSMGGMTIMSLATYRPDVLRVRAKATVLVSTAATRLGGGPAQAARFATAMVASPAVSRAVQSKNGHLLVRSAFGENPVRSHVDLTRNLFGGCHGTVRGDFLTSMSSMDLLEGVATIDVPTTVMVGTRDALTLPKKADQIVATVPGARLVTLQNRGHMLPLEDPDAVTDEIVRAVKG